MSYQTLWKTLLLIGNHADHCDYKWLLQTSRRNLMSLYLSTNSQDLMPVLSSCYPDFVDFLQYVQIDWECYHDYSPHVPLILVPTLATRSSLERAQRIPILEAGRRNRRWSRRVGVGDSDQVRFP